MKTTISPTDEVHGLVKRLKNMSGMSYTGLYSLGALKLVADHARALEYGAKRADLLQEIRAAFDAEIQKLEDETT